jgi:hypothetical protein
MQYLRAFLAVCTFAAELLGRGGQRMMTAGHPHHLVSDVLRFLLEWIAGSAYQEL